jgi:uncharacterized membrane protein
MSTAPLYMDAVITPNRSLSKRGFAIVFGALAAINLLMAIFFIVIGAAPVPIFLGLDVLAVFVAFQVSFRRAMQAERVLVSAQEIRVRYESPRGGRTVWTSPTAFTAVAREPYGQDDWRVRLSLSGRRLTVGSALSPRERGDFGSALQEAVRRARAERYPG